MSLVANALTTPDRLSGFMGITTPTGAQLVAMQTLINSITSFIERYIGRTVKKTTYTQEEYSTERGQTLNLKNFPVISSSQFILEKRGSQLNENQWEVIDSQFYSVDYDSGMIEYMDGVYFFRTRNGYRVTYTAGYDFDNSTTFLGDTDGADIEVACWLIAQDAWKQKGINSNVKSERLGDYSVSYGGLMKSMFDNEQAKQILDAYAEITGDGTLTPLQSI